VSIENAAMTERKTVHESVLVGYFCQACGWIQRDVEARRPRNADESEDRLLRAVNLSHNPLDPAVGDLILQLDDKGVLPQKFFIFELKADWADLPEERRKLIKKLGANLEMAKQHLIRLLTDFPGARDSHLFGGLSPVVEGTRRFTVLLVGLYWDAVFPGEVRSRSSVFHWLNAIVESKTKGGMEFDELAAYIHRLNSLAEVGGAAQTGASRFVVAYQDYQLYLFQEDAVRELVLERRRKQDRVLEQQQAQHRSRSAREQGQR
jgi:hypothetical protein